MSKHSWTKILLIGLSGRSGLTMEEDIPNRCLCLCPLLFYSISLMLGGCATYTDTVRSQTQSITVTSDPSGALVRVTNENGSRVVGRTPVELEADYMVTERIYDKGSCAMAGVAAGAEVMSELNDDEDEDKDKDHKAMEGIVAVLGLMGMVAGAVGGTATCAEADGIVALNPSEMVVTVTLPGHHPRKVVLIVPKDDPLLHFDLETIEDKVTTQPPSHPAGPVETQIQNDNPEAPRIVVLDVTSNTDDIDAALLKELAAYLNEELADELPPDRLVSPHIIKTKQECLVAVSLIDGTTQASKLIAATKTTCNRKGLLAAMEVVAELLTNQPKVQQETTDSE